MFSFLLMGFSFAHGGRGFLWWIWLIIIILIILFLIWVMFKPTHDEKAEVKEETAAKKELKERTEGIIVKEDDLKLIEGIGPKISQILKEHGIKTFKALSEKKPEEIKKILEREGIRGIADPTTWPEQAKLASEGKWDELKELQSKLKGGRRG